MAMVAEDGRRSGHASRNAADAPITLLWPNPIGYSCLRYSSVQGRIADVPGYTKDFSDESYKKLTRTSSKFQLDYVRPREELDHAR